MGDFIGMRNEIWVLVLDLAVVVRYGGGNGEGLTARAYAVQQLSLLEASWMDL